MDDFIDFDYEVDNTPALGAQAGRAGSNRRLEGHGSYQAETDGSGPTQAHTSVPTTHVGETLPTHSGARLVERMEGEDAAQAVEGDSLRRQQELPPSHSGYHDAVVVQHDPYGMASAHASTGRAAYGSLPGAASARRVGTFTAVTPRASNTLRSVGSTGGQGIPLQRRVVASGSHQEVAGLVSRVALAENSPLAGMVAPAPARAIRSRPPILAFTDEMSDATGRHEPATSMGDDKTGRESQADEPQCLSDAGATSRSPPHTTAASATSGSSSGPACSQTPTSALSPITRVVRTRTVHTRKPRHGGTNVASSSSKPHPSLSPSSRNVVGVLTGRSGVDGGDESNNRMVPPIVTPYGVLPRREVSTSRSPSPHRMSPAKLLVGSTTRSPSSRLTNSSEYGTSPLRLALAGPATAVVRDSDKDMLIDRLIHRVDGLTLSLGDMQARLYVTEMRNQALTARTQLGGLVAAGGTTAATSNRAVAGEAEEPTATGTTTSTDAVDGYRLERYAYLATMVQHVSASTWLLVVQSQTAIQ